MLVKLLSGEWVNPDHVTVIEEDYTRGDASIKCKVWAKCNAGYGTKSFSQRESMNECAARINGTKKE